MYPIPMSSSKFLSAETYPRPIETRNSICSLPFSESVAMGAEGSRISIEGSPVRSAAVIFPFFSVSSVRIFSQIEPPSGISNLTKKPLLGMCLTQVGTVSQRFVRRAHWGLRPAFSSGTRASRAGQGARPTLLPE